MHTTPAPTRRPAGHPQAVPLTRPARHYRVTLLEVWRDIALIEASSPSEARRRWRAQRGRCRPALRGRWRGRGRRMNPATDRRLLDTLQLANDLEDCAATASTQAEWAGALFAAIERITYRDDPLSAVGLAVTERIQICHLAAIGVYLSDGASCNAAECLAQAKAARWEARP